jgi:cytochrome c553
MTVLAKRLSSLVFMALTTTAFAAGNPELGQKKAAVCMACHGTDGNSMALPPPAEPWPKLAGQVPEYIVKQLHDFKAGRRSNEQMSPQAQAVSEVDIPDIAAYFAQQKVKPNDDVNKELLAAGEKLFYKGKGRPEVVAACVGCHGFGGIGNRDWKKLMAIQPVILAPAIGSQHANYLVKQLKAYKDGTRSNDTAQVMRNITARLSEQDIEAVATFVASLTR